MCPFDSFKREWVLFYEKLIRFPFVFQKTSKKIIRVLRYQYLQIVQTAHKRNSNVKSGYKGLWGLSDHLNTAEDRIRKGLKDQKKLPRMHRDLEIENMQKKLREVEDKIRWSNVYPMRTSKWKPR